MSKATWRTPMGDHNDEKKVSEYWICRTAEGRLHLRRHWRSSEAAIFTNDHYHCSNSEIEKTKKQQQKKMADWRERAWNPGRWLNASRALLHLSTTWVNWDDSLRCLRGVVPRSVPEYQSYGDSWHCQLPLHLSRVQGKIRHWWLQRLDRDWGAEAETRLKKARTAPNTSQQSG